MLARTPREIGAFVKETRRLKGLTQATLAARAGVSRSWLVSFEAGKRSLEIGLALDVLGNLDIRLDLQRVGESLSGHAKAETSAKGDLRIPTAEEALAHAAARKPPK